MLAAIVVPLAVAAILVPFRSSIPNTDALAMILVVVAVAKPNWLAGILAALSVAVWFDFFLTQPYETFSITRRTDIETTVLLLVIGIAVTEIAVWGTPPAPDREQAGGLSRRNQQRRAGGGGRRLGVGADRAGDQAAHSVALAAVVQLPARSRRDFRPARLRHDG